MCNYKENSKQGKEIMIQQMCIREENIKLNYRIIYNNVNRNYEEITLKM